MGDIIKAILDFFTYKGLHIGYKLSAFILTLCGLCFINDILGVSRHYFLNSTLEQIIELKQIDPNILKDDTIINHKFLQVKQEIIADRSKTSIIVTKAKSLINHLTSSNSSARNSIPTNAHFDSPDDTFDWFDFSAMFFFDLLIVLCIAVTINMGFDIRKTFREKLSGVAGLVVLSVCAYCVGKFYKFIISFIPLIPNFTWINYIIYAALPIVGSVFILVRIGRSK